MEEIKFSYFKTLNREKHPCTQDENFKVISSGFRNNTKKRKLSGAL